jgi:outer membrane lipoprotein-sorting protein
MNVKRILLIQFCLLLALGVFAFAKDAKPKKSKAKKPVATSATTSPDTPAASAPAAGSTQVAKLAEPASPPAPAKPADTGNSLEKVLTTMDQQAAAFHNAQADFIWDQYTKVVDDHDQQKGTIYFRRQSKNDVEMFADITQPPKQVLFSGGKVRLYEPKVDRITEYDAGKNKADFESFLVLGFGGAGHDMTKSFDVKYAGMEQAQGVNAAKLELTPKSSRVRGMFTNIILWIDPAKGVSVQQQFFDHDGNYRLAKYSNIQLNQKLNDDKFKLKTTSKTTVVRPNG